MSSPRNLAWPRLQRAKHAKPHSKAPSAKPQKSWKLLYTRSVKLRRAQQFGMVWPNAEWAKLLMDINAVNVLFICSRNQWRSPTGEHVWRGWSCCAKNARR